MAQPWEDCINAIRLITKPKDSTEMFPLSRAVHLSGIVVSRNVVWRACLSAIKVLRL